jgi:hypothetical protein
MKLLETYSRNSSVDIKHKPKITEKFYPLGAVSKYITLQTRSGMVAKDYGHFEEVVTILTPFLEKEGIKILHLGLGENIPAIKNTIHLINQTSIHQACYLIKRSLCHFSVDSWGSHYAGAEDVPLVSLYGSTTVANHSPYFYNKDKTILLESHRNGNKATFSAQENPKTVDLINPELVAKSVLKLLNIPNNINYTTYYIGNLFNNRMVQSIPTQVVNVSNLGIQSLVVRMDIEFNEQNLAKQLQVCPCSILTRQPINPNLLQQFRDGILEVIYFIDKNNNPEFVRYLHDLRIPYKLISELPDEELNRFKLDYIDFHIILKKDILPPKDFELKDISKFQYKTNQFFLGREKIYQSEYSYINNQPLDNFENKFQDLTEENIDILWKDKDFSYLIENN